MADPLPPDSAKASLLGAAIGGLVLLTVALPLFFQAVAWWAFATHEVSPTSLAVMAAAGIVPVPLAAGVAFVRRANVRATALLVGVPQAVLFLVLALLGAWVRPA